MNMFYTIKNCSLGLILISFIEEEVSAIFFDDNKDYLVEQLHQSFPNFDFALSTSKKEQLITKEIIEQLEHPNPQYQPNFKLKLIGTNFQKSVWNALMQVPFGSTATYSDIAISINNPKAVRAVATACGSNQIALIIPCHRIIRVDGKDSGYRWGLNRKNTLIEAEHSLGKK